MPWVGFELTIPALKRAKTVHALDRSATDRPPNSILYEFLVSYTKFHAQPVVAFPFHCHDKVKLKEKLYLFLITRHDMKIWGYRWERSASRTGLFTLRDGA
jgi:hypothetical protein